MNHDELLRVAEDSMFPGVTAIFEAEIVCSRKFTDTFNRPTIIAMLGEIAALRKALDAGKRMRNRVTMHFGAVVDECEAFDAAVKKLDESKPS